ncbi:MAG: deoxynucleoside kinase [Chloroflexota bacterium]
MTKRIVVVAGNIGAGKTSLTKGIGARLGWQSAYESVADNPYLGDFYANMCTWSFHLQVFFLGHRAQQYSELVMSPQSAILDRSIYEDAYIFARALHQMGNLTDRDYASYRQVFSLVVKNLPPPDLLVYLKAPVPVLLERIHRRGREIETGITAAYLTLLDSFYEDWLTGFDACPVLVVRSDDLDFVNQPGHLDIVANHILEQLTGCDGLPLPAGVS